ncbi:MAG: hypothetical protein ACI3YZ_06520 [Prevotella sp.]
MVTLAIISAIVFALYLIVMAKFHGIQPSISDNYYVSRHPWTFTLVMWLVAFSMLPPMLSATTEAWQFSAFLSCAGIAFVGAAAAYKQQLTNTVHIAGASTAGLFSIVWAYTVCPPLPTLALIVAAYLLLSKPRHMVYWIELTAFVMTYLTYFVSLIIN